MPEPGLGAKDSSNHLVAGFLRSFPQDSWSQGATRCVVGPVLRCRATYERLPGRKISLTYLQTAKGHGGVPAAPAGRPVSAGPKAQNTNEWCGSMWAITGKQYWRCGVIRRCTYGARVLAHLQSPQRMLPAIDSRAVAMKVGIRYGVCNNSPAEAGGSKNG